MNQVFSPSEKGNNKKKRKKENLAHCHSLHNFIKQYFGQSFVQVKNTDACTDSYTPRSASVFTAITTSLFHPLFLLRSFSLFLSLLFSLLLSLSLPLLLSLPITSFFLSLSLFVSFSPLFFSLLPFSLLLLLQFLQGSGGEREILVHISVRTHIEEGQSSRISLETERVSIMKPVSQYGESLMISTLTLKQIFLSHIKFHPSTHDFGENHEKKANNFHGRIKKPPSTTEAFYMNDLKRLHSCLWQISLCAQRWFHCQAFKRGRVGQFTYIHNYLNILTTRIALILK